MYTLAFLAAAIILMLTDHTAAGAWCIVGAILAS